MPLSAADSMLLLAGPAGQPEASSGSSGRKLACRKCSSAVRIPYEPVECRMENVESKCSILHVVVAENIQRYREDLEPTRLWCERSRRG